MVPVGSAVEQYLYTVSGAVHRLNLSLSLSLLSLSRQQLDKMATVDL